MRQVIILLAFATLMFEANTAHSQSFGTNESQLEVYGFARNYMGVLFENGGFSIAQNTLDLSLEHERDNVSFFANPYFYQYSDKDNVFEFRELYMDFYSKKVDVRIGKQQIIWGQADGVFITDVVSPKNLTDFLLWDFNEIRIGVNSVKLNFYPKPDHDFELIWIPVFSGTIAPENGSIWQPSMDVNVPVIFDLSHSEVASSINNSEFFARYSLTKSAIDLQIIGGYTWDDDPSLHVEKQFEVDTVTMQSALSSLIISPEHHRLSLAGLSFNTDVKGFIVRGEGAFYKGKYFQTTDPTVIDALVEKDYINYVLGLDKSFGYWKVSGQFIQKDILDYDDAIQNDEIDNLVTIMVNRTLFREKLRLEFFSYIGLNNEDALVRLRAFYFPFDGMSLEVGTNVFVGDNGLFGQYDSNDMLYSRIKYSF